MKSKQPRKNAKIGPGKTNSQKSAGFKMQMKIGGEIASKLPERLGRPEVAEIMGISAEMVRRIEYRALYKVQAKLVELRQELLNG
jgi:hypothetical protein